MLWWDGDGLCLFAKDERGRSSGRKSRAENKHMTRKRILFERRLHHSAQAR